MGSQFAASRIFGLFVKTSLQSPALHHTKFYLCIEEETEFSYVVETRT